MHEEAEILLSNVNFGKGKYFSISPMCNFQEKEIPCLPLLSPRGGITGTLLVEVLIWFDRHKICERKVKGGPKPFFIVNRHGWRMDLVFVEYISDKIMFGI